MFQYQSRYFNRNASVDDFEEEMATERQLPEIKIPFDLGASQEQQENKSNVFMKKRQKRMQNVSSQDEQSNNSETEVNFIEQITRSIEFMQMQIYFQNHKYEKALVLVEKLYDDYKALGEPNTLTFILKYKYQIQINIKHLAIRDAEITLHNIIGLIDENMQEYQVLAPHEILRAHSDLLLHYLNTSHRQMNLKSARLDKQTAKISQLLKSKQMLHVLQKCPDLVAFANLIIAISKFLSESDPQPIAEVKRLLKEALTILCGTQNIPIYNFDANENNQENEDNDNQDQLSGMRNEDLKQLILYNLACINYAEITAYLERLSNAQTEADLHEEQSLVEQVRRIEAERNQEQIDEAKAKEELYIQERELRYREQIKAIKKQSQQRLKIFDEKRMAKYKDPKFRQRVTQSNRKLEKFALRMHKVAALKRKSNRINSDVNSIESIKARHQLTKSSDSDQLSKFKDVLLGSYLLQARPTILDVIKYTGIGHISKRSGGQQLPQNTVSQLYEHLLLDRFDNLAAFTDQNQLHQSHFNEVVPLLYTCLKLGLAGDPETSLEAMHLIKSIEDFRREDPKMQLLKTSHRVSKPVEMLARLYVLDSLKYPEEAKYWLQYATVLVGRQIEELQQAKSENDNAQTLVERKAISQMKRIQALECAYLIDQGQNQQAERILKSMLFKIIFKNDQKKSMLNQLEFSDEYEERDVQSINSYTLEFF